MHILINLYEALIVKLKYSVYMPLNIFFSIISETNFPEIKEGGTPGPGTVNWPVKNKLLTFLLFNPGLIKAVCDNVLAIP